VTVYTYKAALVRVIDGDTVEMTADLGFRVFLREKFRLARIDTPELVGPDRSMAIAAKDFVNLALSTAREIVIRTTKDDKYGRWLAEIDYLPRTSDAAPTAKTMSVESMRNLNDELLRNGLAKLYS
jgi:endonuclease YncB( thermonuclease family)